MKTVDTNFRVEFGKLDDAVLISPVELAAVIGAPSVGAVYTSLARGELPEPLVRENRRLRWSVGQIRNHISSMVTVLLERQQSAVESGLPIVRMGKRRSTVPTINGAGAA